MDNLENSVRANLDYLFYNSVDFHIKSTVKWLLTRS
jgi:hypothetical protein